jgi:hypothetical protein
MTKGQRVLLVSIGVDLLLVAATSAAAPWLVTTYLPVLAKRYAQVDASVEKIRYTLAGVELSGLHVKSPINDLTVRRALLAYPKTRMYGVELVMQSGEGKNITVSGDADMVIEKARTVRFVAPSMKINLLGIAARIAADVTFRNKVGDAHCTLRDATFDPLLVFLGKDDQFAWSGFFSGPATFGFTEKGFTALDVKLESQDSGTFAVKQESALAFVKESRHMDDA